MAATRTDDCDGQGSGLRRQGSIRKVLPSVPDVDTQLSMAAKIIDRRPSSLRNCQSYGPFFLEYSLLAEYGLFEKQKLPGIYMIPAAKSPLQWFGVMFIRQGLYLGGVFRFTVEIPENYPDGECPGIVFCPPVFHPQINPETGALDVTKGFQKWRRNVNHIWHLLLYARRIFYKIDCSDPSNVEAAALYGRNLEEYQVRTKECVDRSIDRLYDPPVQDDPHAIKFSRWNPEVHGPILKLLKVKNAEITRAVRPPNSNGLSWVQKGSLRIFSNDATMS